MVWWLSLRTHNTGVCELESRACQNENIIGEEGNEKSPHIVNFPRKNSDRYLLVSARLEIEYAMQASLFHTHASIWLQPWLAQALHALVRQAVTPTHKAKGHAINEACMVNSLWNDHNVTHGFKNPFF